MIKSRDIYKKITGMLFNRHTIAVMMSLLFSVNLIHAQTSTCVLLDTDTSSSAYYLYFEEFCQGANAGVLVMTPLDTSNTYNYSIDGGITLTTDSAFTGLSAGMTYYIYVEETANPGCHQYDTVFIPNPQDSLTVVVSVNSDITCYGDSTGIATVGVIGGVQPYTYLWPNGQTTQQANGLGAGNQYVVVTDGNGCTDTTYFNVGYLYAPFSVTLDTIQQVQCFGECNAMVQLTTTGAVSPYTYSWSNGQTYLGPGLDTAFNLCWGGHSVIIQDAYGCDTTILFTIDEPAELLTWGQSIQPVQCYGADDGIAYAIGIGGAGTYTYSWSTYPYDSTLIYTNNDTVNNLTPGIHTVGISDTNGCTAFDTVLITEPTQLVVEIIDSLAVYSYCIGTNSGQLCAVASGGTPGYSYAWNNSTQLTACAVNLSAGQYTVSVIDDRSCVASDSFDLDSITNSMLAANFDFNINHISCNGLYDGSIQVSPNGTAGGVAPFTYTWNGPISPTPPFNPFSATGANISNLYEGNYSLIIEDANGCIINTDADIYQPNFLEYSINTVIDESCSGDGPYPSGTQIITPSASSGSCNGYVTLTINGGTAPYFYDNSFSGIFPIPLVNQSLVFQDSIISNFCDGAYDIHITDANGCQGNVTWGGAFTANIGEGFQVYITGVKTIDASCFNLDDGVAWVEGGADPALNYSWQSDNSGQPSGIILDTVPYSVGFIPGDYWLVAHYSDAMSFGQNYPGCDVSMDFTIYSPPAITSGAIVEDVTCFGYSDGSIDLNASGGVGSFTFLWDTLSSIPFNNITNEDQNQLSPGVYTVNITDATGCVLTESITVGEPNPLITNFVNLSNVSCYGFSDGEVTAFVANASGTPPFTYNWFDANGPIGQFTANATGLEGGTYTVIIIDDGGSGCQATFNTTITEPDPILMTVEQNSYFGQDNLGNPYHISCYGASDGSLIVSNTGGTGTITYEWQDATGSIVSNNQNTGSNLSAGTYTVYVEDDNGCQENQSLDLNEPNQLEANVWVSNYPGGFNISCYDLSDGWAQSLPTGGYPGASGYQYLWENSSGVLIAQNDSAHNLPANDLYTVTVIDANGCQDIVTTALFTEPLPFVADVTTTDYAGATHAPFTVNFIDNTSSLDPYNFTWVWNDGIESAPNGTTTFAHEFTEENIGLNEVFVVLTNEITTCQDTVFFMIDAQGIPEITNVFTPNGDGINDEFSFGEHEMQKVIVQIFNRWGQEVYAWEGENKKWKGVDKNNEDVPEGAYFYVLKADGVDGYYYEEKGTITLIR